MNTGNYSQILVSLWIYQRNDAHFAGIMQFGSSQTKNQQVHNLPNKEGAKETAWLTCMWPVVSTSNWSWNRGGGLTYDLTYEPWRHSAEVLKNVILLLFTSILATCLCPAESIFRSRNVFLWASFKSLFKCHWIRFNCTTWLPVFLTTSQIRRCLRLIDKEKIHEKKPVKCARFHRDNK